MMIEMTKRGDMSAQDAMIDATTVATRNARNRGVDGRRSQNGPRVRAEKSVRKSEIDILRYMSMMSSGYGR